jgi:hypothetical protein
VSHQCQGRDLFHKAKRWTEDTRLLQKLAITVTHPFRRIRSFEDCLADEAGRCEPFSAPKNTLLAGKIAGNLHLSGATAGEPSLKNIELQRYFERIPYWGEQGITMAGAGKELAIMAV